VISTVLPGTISREIKPIIEDNPYFKLCYNPFFIAMGTTMRDFLKPEIVLFGVEDKDAAQTAKKFYRTLHHQPFYETTIENAELIKVCYNTFISSKISIVNTIMEMCHKLPNTNVDDVTNALKMCDERIISDKYLSGGMGDGGGCHPRDNIALSWLSNELQIRYNWFDNIMMQREKQTEWLADLIEGNRRNSDTIYILGKSFKPETNIQTGSPSILLKNIFEERWNRECEIYDPYVDDINDYDFKKGLYFIGTKHPDFTDFKFPYDSIVIDPWRYIPKQDDIKVIHIGDSLL
jgi:UDPglucose 6-dehydrogenase